MKVHLECIPCFLEQAVRISRHATEDPGAQEALVRAVLRECEGMDFSIAPARMGQRIHRLAREISGNADPYREAKLIQNRDALALIPSMREKIRASEDPLGAAIRLSVAGNLIDYGPSQGAQPTEFKEAIQRIFSQTAGLEEIAELKRELHCAASILILGDNAGEIALDLVAIEEMERAGVDLSRVTYAVRGAPVLNDATLEDATAVGITDKVRVIDTGTDAPGILMEQACEVFRQALAEADLVLSKGQGNFETLEEELAAKPPWTTAKVFYLLMVKCPIVSRHTGLPRGSLLVARADRLQGI
jgi:uncharacterized protein with ATP-grasp and redox domains